jgi:hypothetical protein
MKENPFIVIPIAGTRKQLSDEGHSRHETVKKRLFLKSCLESGRPYPNDLLVCMMISQLATLIVDIYHSALT